MLVNDPTFGPSPVGREDVGSVASMAPLRVIVSGGGTGGHVYPAIAIADELKRLRPGTEFLFVGAEGKMEMDKVPMAGYQIVGLPIRGLQRKLSLANLSFPFRLISSLWKSWSLVKSFRPDVVVGTGGYAGGPVLYAAAKLGVPTLIQEPNAFAGLANKWLGKQVDKVCVAFPGMEQFFPIDKLVVTGNPVREDYLSPDPSSRERGDGSDFGGVTEAVGVTQALPVAPEPTSESPPTFPLSMGEGPGERVLLMGGSGGARSLNEAMRDSTKLIQARPQVQWLWQCGKFYYEAFRNCATAVLPNVTISAFIDDMATAYQNSGVVIGRAGSTTIAEVQFLGKPTILVPSPWVAEDHQTMNAKALAERDAAVLVADKEVTEKLVPAVFDILDDENRRKELSANVRKMAQTGAVNRIAKEILNLVSSSENFLK